MENRNEHKNFDRVELIFSRDKYEDKASDQQPRPLLYKAAPT